MALSLADLRNRNKTAEHAKITAALTKKADYDNEDEGFWKPTRDKAGNATATIRFLPALTDEDLFYEQYYTHSWQQGGKGGKWYIENCPTSIGITDGCPVCAMNKEVYSSMPKDQATKIAGARTRKQVFVANILVVKDPANPENDGKVFLFKFGKKIMDKINEKVSPVYDDIPPVKVYDIDEGANFRLIQAKEDGYPSYAKSFFMDKSPISEDDSVLQGVLDGMKSLRDVKDPKKFKSMADLQKRLDFVMSDATTSTEKAESTAKSLSEEVRARQKAKTERSAPAPEPVASTTTAFEDVPELDDLEKFFEDATK